MTEPRSCPECRTAVPEGAPLGLCPRCLLAIGLGAVEVGPRSFGDYELLEEIAHGGMGSVFKARQTALNRLVALKVVSAAALDTRELVERLRAEAEMGASLSHPNIVPIYEVGEHNGRHFFSMGLIEGPDLGRALARRRREGGGAYPPRDAAQLLIVVARAVHHAHQHGVLHRDIKPGNILLDAAGIPHLTDFGLAKLLERESSLTLANAVLGTPAYMAPEQARGNMRHLTTAADVYGLGAVLYEMVTSCPPFSGTSSLETIRRVIEEDPRRPSTINGTVDRDLETICLKCLEKEPGRRYASAAALADDLERWLGHEPILARRSPPVERIWKWARRQPVVASALATLALIVALGLTGVVWQWRRAEAADRESTRASVKLRQALSQMEAIQLGRAEEFIGEQRRPEALTRWALVLRNNPSNRLAAERLMSTLTHRAWAGLACPPLEHSNRLTVATFSPDGSRITTCSADHTALIWDAATGRRVAGPLVHGDEINTSGFSPDGRRVVTASDDKTARLWDAATGQPLSAPLQHAAPVSSAQFDSTGRLVLTTSGSLAQLWDVETGQPHGPEVPAPPFILDATFSPDGTRYALAQAKGGVTVCDVDGSTAPRRLEGHTGDVESVAFSPDSKRLVTASNDGTACVWDLASGEHVMTLRHSSRVWNAAWSPDGGRIVTTSRDRTAQLWNAANGEKLGSPMMHADDVRRAMFSPEGLRVATASRDHTARVWDAMSGRPLTEPLTHDATVFSAMFDPQGERLLTACNGKAALVWDVVRTAAAATSWMGEAISAPHFSPDGSRLVLASDLSHTEVIDPATRRRVARLQTDSRAWVVDVAFAPDGTRFATAADDGTAFVWGVRDGRMLQGPMHHRSGLLGIAFSPDGRGLLTTDSRGATAWDLRTGESRFQLDHPGSGSRLVRFSPDGRWMLTVGDRTVRLWDARTGNPVIPPLEHARRVGSAEFSPKGTHLLTTADEPTFIVWDLATGTRQARRWEHRGPVLRAVYSRDGRQVLSTTRGYGLQLWDLETGRSLTGEFGPPQIAGAELSPRLNQVCVKTDRAILQWWDLASGQRLGEGFEVGKLEAQWRESPDGNRVAVTYERASTLCEIPRATLPAPRWLPNLAEALAATRFDPRGELEPVPPAERWNAQQELSQWVREQPLGGAAEPSGDGGFYSRWATWFLASPVDRTVMPSSSMKRADHARELANQDTPESVSEALRLAPGDPLVMSRLATQRWGSGATNPMVDWLSLRATQLGPGHATVWWTRANVLRAEGRRMEALSAMAHGKSLAADNPKFWNDYGFMLREAGSVTQAIDAYSRSIELTRSPSPDLRQLRRDAFRGRQYLYEQQDRPDEAARDQRAGGWIPPRDPRTNPRCLDLSPVLNGSVVELAIEHRLPEPGLGACRLGGLEFDIRGCVRPEEAAPQAGGSRRLASTVWIPVGTRCAALHFLQAASDTATDGTELGHHKVRYVDGEEVTVPIVYGEDLRAITSRAGSTGEARRARAVDPPGIAHPSGSDESLRLYISSWRNPHPEREIESYALASAQTASVPLVVAVTVEP